MRKKSRRPNNSGIFNWRKGKLYVYVSLPKNNGIYPRKLIKVCSTLKEGEEAVMEYKKANGITVEAKTTMADFLTDWVNARSRGKKSETTLNTYRMQINNNIVPYIGHISLGELRSVDIDYLTSKLSDRKLSRNTILLVVRIINAAINYAINQEWLLKNVVKKSIRIKAEPRKKAMPNKLQVSSLLKQFMQEKHYKFPLLFCLLLGLRRGEALGVKWEDIDLESKTIIINKQIVNTGGRIVEKKPKSDSSIRSLLMPNCLVEELRKVPKNYRFGYIVKQTHRKPILFYNRFVIIRNLLGLDNITPHSLRHINSTYLLDGGASLDSVSRHLGHSSVRVTGDIYAHEISETQEKKANIIDKLVSDSLSYGQ